jgi:hypothetical protein
MADNQQQRNPNQGNQGNPNQGNQGNQNQGNQGSRNPNDRGDRTRAMEDEAAGRTGQRQGESVEENR